MVTRGLDSYSHDGPAFETCKGDTSGYEPTGETAVVGFEAMCYKAGDCASAFPNTVRGYRDPRCADVPLSRDNINFDYEKAEVSHG